LEAISTGLSRLTADIGNRYPNATVIPKKIHDQNVALRVSEAGSIIKIEPNLVIRGAVFQSHKKKIVREVEDEFGLSASCLCLSFADLYGGKICAALDRQHPRDLFDIKLLFENDGFTDEIRQAFIAYLISHPRPISELLSPNLLDIEPVFLSEFSGMTRSLVSLDDSFQYVKN